MDKDQLLAQVQEALDIVADHVAGKEEHRTVANALHACRDFIRASDRSSED